MCELSLPKTIVSCICKLLNSCCDHCTLELQKDICNTIVRMRNNRTANACLNRTRSYYIRVRAPCQDNVCPSAFEAPMCSDRSMNSGACKYKTQELVSTKDDGLVSSFSFLPRCIMCELSLPKTIVSCITYEFEHHAKITYVLVLLKLQCAVIAA
jgi:hypothetical protein